MRYTTQHPLLALLALLALSIASVAVAQDTRPAADHQSVPTREVAFLSHGIAMKGVLHLPPSHQEGQKHPVVVVTGSWTTVKEQMAGLYARKLAEQGFAAFTFDFRNFGESGGEPRQLESARLKAEDIVAASAFVHTLPEVDSEHVGGLGVCASAGYMGHAIAQGAGLDSFATVAAWLHDNETVNVIYGGADQVAERIERSKKAEKTFKATGEVIYVPAFSSTADAAMVGEGGYYGNEERGAIKRWSNRFAEMAWEEWLTFDAVSAAPKVNVPTLFVHSEQSALPQGVRAFAKAMPGESRIEWIEGVHSDFYDQEKEVNAAVQALVAHYRATLGKGGR